jgi:hypothetical protein
VLNRLAVAPGTLGWDQAELQLLRELSSLPVAKLDRLLDVASELQKQRPGSSAAGSKLLQLSRKGIQHISQTLCTTAISLGCMGKNRYEQVEQMADRFMFPFVFVRSAPAILTTDVTKHLVLADVPGLQKLLHGVKGVGGGEGAGAGAGGAAAAQLAAE